MHKFNLRMGRLLSVAIMLTACNSIIGIEEPTVVERPGKGGTAGAKSGSGGVAGAGLVGIGATSATGNAAGAGGTTEFGGSAGIANGGLAGSHGGAEQGGSAGLGGLGGASDSTSTVATGGTVTRDCPTDGAISCGEHAARARRRCMNGMLENYEPCAADELCDTASGSGNCAKVHPDCVGRQPGETFCAGAFRKTCGPDLLDIKQNDCGTLALCSVGSGPRCGVCTTSEYRCNDGTLEICNPSHTGFDFIKNCGEAPCSVGAGDCTALVCVNAGDLRCEGDNLEICTADRTRFEPMQTCLAGFCDGVAKQCDVCQAGVARCAPNGIERVQCSADGQAEVVEPCPTATPHCVGSGVCVACTPGTEVADCKSPNDCSQASCSVTSNYTCTLNPYGANVECHTAGTGNQDGVCNGAGQCLQCLSSPQCVPPNDCHTGVCNANGTCGFPQREVGSQCAGGYCSAAGTCVACTVPEHCSAATCYKPVCAANNTCTQSPQAGGFGCAAGKICDGAGNCVECYGVGQTQCATGNVCRDNACVSATEYLGWRDVTGTPGVYQLYTGTMYLKRIDAVAHPSVLKAFGAVGTGTGASIKFALYADNGSGTAPSGTRLAEGSAVALKSGVNESNAQPNNIDLAAGAYYWIALKVNVDLTANNGLVVGTATPTGKLKSSQPYTDAFPAFATDTTTGPFTSQIAVYLIVQDTR